MRSIFLALAFLLVSALVHAQNVASDDPRADARLHVGPFYITPTVQLKELGWDTNVFNQQTGQEEKDFTFTVTPRIVTWVPFARRAAIKADTAVDLVYFRKFSAERSVDPDLSVRGEIYLNHLKLFAEPSYLDTRQRPNFEIDVRARREERAIDGGAEIRVFPKLSFEVAGGQRRTRFDADQYYDGTSLDQWLNRNSAVVRVVPRWRATPLTTIALRVARVEDRFQFAHQRDTNSVMVMPGVELKARALISGTAYAGVRKFTALDPAATPDFQGLVAHATLAYTMLGSTWFYISGDRDLEYSYEQTQPYYISNGLGLTVRRQLSGRFDIMGGVAGYRYNYQNAKLPTFVALPERTDTTKNLSASVGYRVGRDGRFGVGASYWTRNSNRYAVHEYAGLRIGTSLTYGF